MALPEEQYNAILNLYRNRNLADIVELEKRIEWMTKQYGKKLAKTVQSHTTGLGTIDTRYTTLIESEIDKAVLTYQKELTTLLDTNILVAAKTTGEGRRLATKLLVSFFADEVKNSIEKELLNRQIYGTGLAKNVRNKVFSMRFADGKKLSERIWDFTKISRENLHGIVNAGISQGRSAVEISKSIDKYLGVTGKAYTTAIKPSITGRGTVKYNALRMARSEINIAYHIAHQEGAVKSPLVVGVRWNLSGSHPKYDICDELATQDLYGLGKGVYPPKHMPEYPHPNCFCHKTDVLAKGQQLMKIIDQINKGVA